MDEDVDVDVHSRVETLTKAADEDEGKEGEAETEGEININMGKKEEVIKEVLREEGWVAISKEEVEKEEDNFLPPLSPERKDEILGSIS